MTTDHKFVKTTPKPSATKNRSGEDVGPDPGVGLLVGEGIAVVDDDADDRAFTIAEVGVASGSWVVVCVPSRPRLWMSRSKT